MDGNGQSMLDVSHFALSFVFVFWFQAHLSSSFRVFLEIAINRSFITLVESQGWEDCSPTPLDVFYIAPLFSSGKIKKLHKLKFA